MLHRVILIIILAAPLGSATAAADSLTIQAPDDATVRGIVLENTRGCERDLPCTLRLAVQGRVVQVIYHHGDSEQVCLQPALVYTGLALKAGERIIARGRYRRNAAVVTIDVCSAPGAQLQRVPR